MQVDELLPYLKDHRDELVRAAEGREIQTQPRPKGRNTQRGERTKSRKLGIPTVVDRVIQQAIAQELTPII